MTMTLGSPAHERIVAIRRDLHQHPELSWQEERTAEVIADRLGELGIAFRKGVAGTGILADIPPSRLNLRLPPDLRPRSR